MLKKLLSCGMILTVGVTLAYADVSYTMKVKSPNSPAETLMTTYIKGKRQRTETAIDMGTVKMKTVSLTLCDLKQTAQVDDELKIYTLAPMDASTGADKSKVATGTVSNTYTVKDLGTETIAGLKARHSLITTRSQATGCAGSFDNSSKVEIWTAPIQVLNCPEAANYSQPNCRVKLEEKGDVKAMRSAYDGMPVKMITFQGDQQTSVQEMTEHSTKALDDSLFNFGKDYKKVTTQEFQQAQQQKMMKMYQR